MENVTPSSTLSGVSTDAAKAAITTSPLTFSTLSTSNGSTWSFTVQKAGEGNFANIGSLLITLTDCDDKPVILSESDVISASVSGERGIQPLTVSDKEGKGSACDMSAVTGYIRFTDFPEKATDGTVYTISFTLKNAVKVKSADIWTRISKNCFTAKVDGPACTVVAPCGFGKGYFHNPNNWPVDEIKIGGVIYTKDEAVKLITSDKKYGGESNGKGGIEVSKKAFAQGVTLLLNYELGTMPTSILGTELGIIEAFLSPLGKLTLENLALSDKDDQAAKDANAAQDVISKWISENDCENK